MTVHLVDATDLWCGSMDLHEEGGNARPLPAEKGAEDRGGRIRLEDIPDAALLTRSDGKVLSANAAARRMFDRTGEDLQALALDGLVVPDERSAAFLDELSATGRARGELTCRRSNGATFQGEVSASSCTDADGAVKNVHLIRDISGQRAVEETLRSSDERFRSALRHAPVSVAVQDRDLRCVWTFNPQAVSPKYVLGLTDEEVFKPDDVRWMTSIKRRVLDEGVEIREQRWFDGPSGPVYLDVTWSPVHDVGGHVSGITSVSIDLTRTKATEDALKESEAKYRSLFDENVSVMMLIDPESGRIVDANQAAVEYYGYDHAALTALSITDINSLPPDEVRAEMERSVSGRKRSFIFRHRLRGGEVRDVEVFSGPITVRGRKLLYSVVHDVTERRRMEQQLSESEERFRTLIGEAPVAIGMAREGKVIFGNQCYLEMFGLRGSDDVYGRPFTEHVLTEDRETILGIASRVAAGEVRVVELEIRGVRMDGTVFPFHVALARVVLPDGPANLSFFTDVTERRKVEDALKESEAKYRQLFESVQEVFLIYRLIYDAQGKIVDWVFEDLNPAGLAILGRDKVEEVRDRRGSELLGLDVARFYLPMMEEARRSEGATTFQYRSPSVGRDFLSSYIVHGDRLIIAQMDITELKKAQQEVEDYAMRLKRSNAELQQFAYVASHDLQEPLRMVVSYLGLMESRFGDELPVQAKEYMGFAVSGAARMKRLIDDLLQYSRVDSRPLRLERVDMNELVASIREDLHLSIDESGSELLADALPSVCADRRQIKQLLTNLITNALKFHDDRTPRVEIAATISSKESIFSVRDNGIGIDPRFRDKLFVMFQRLHTHDEFPGTGIGLAICKKIVERHGGRIWFDSEVGKGTTFYFTIPMPERGARERDGTRDQVR